MSLGYAQDSCHVGVPFWIKGGLPGHENGSDNDTWATVSECIMDCS